MPRLILALLLLLITARISSADVNDINKPSDSLIGSCYFESNDAAQCLEYLSNGQSKNPMGDIEDRIKDCESRLKTGWPVAKFTQNEACKDGAIATCEVTYTTQSFDLRMKWYKVGDFNASEIIAMSSMQCKAMQSEKNGMTTSYQSHL